MKTKPFDIKYRPQIESGEYKVVTREDRPVEIIKWDLKGDFPVIGVYFDEKNDRDTAVQVTANGRCSIKPGDYYCDDFFIINDKPELTEFEETLKGIVNGFGSDVMTNEGAKNSGIRLLEVARKELMLNCENKYKEGRAVGIELGKIEIMKDMPKWRKCQNFEHNESIHQIVIRDGLMFASSTKEIGDWFLDLPELEKLPKED